MPSEFQMILMALQSDLNGIMLSSVAANQAIANMLGLYSDEEYSEDKNKRCVSKWSIALTGLADALESFQSNIVRLEGYLDDKG